MASRQQSDEHARAETAIAAVAETVRVMTSPGGCAWHEAQTHASLTPFLTEEAAELIDAIERELPADQVRSELGDVLYQVLFHAAIAERDGEGYDLASVAEALNEKLIARHPHVFGDRGPMTVQQLNAEWERLKEDAAGAERGSRGPLEGIPAGMPTLARAAKVVERLKRAGLIDPHPWPDAAAPGDVARGPSPDSAAPRPDTLAETALLAPEDEIGDALFALVVRANAAGVDPDRALRRAVDRFAAEV